MSPSSKTVYIGQDYLATGSFSDQQVTGSISGCDAAEQCSWSASAWSYDGSMTTWGHTYSSIPSSVSVDARSQVGDYLNIQKRCYSQTTPQTATMQLVSSWSGNALAQAGTTYAVYGRATSNFDVYRSFTGSGESRVGGASSSADGINQYVSHPGSGSDYSTGSVSLGTGLITPYVRLEAQAWSEGIFVYGGGQSSTGWGQSYTDVRDNGYHAQLQQVRLTWNDPTPPSTSASIIAGSPGGSGWYTSGVTVDLAAADYQSCVQLMAYSIDGGSWQYNYIDPNYPYVDFYIGSEGYHTVYYASMNFRGQWESTKSIAVKIDYSAPSVTLTTPRSGFCYAQDIEVTCAGLVTVAVGTQLTLKANAYDSYSGVNNVRFYVDGSYIGTDYSYPYQATWSIPIGVGTHSTRACAYDYAGNSACSWGPSVTTV